MIAGKDHDDWNAAGRLLCRERGRPGRRDYQVDPALDQLGGEGRKALDIALGPPVFDDEILTLDPAELAQLSQESSTPCFTESRVGVLR